jgi:hypothetical protein
MLGMGKVKSHAEDIAGGFEIFFVPIAAGAAFDGHDLAVKAFSHGVGDMVRQYPLRRLPFAGPYARDN